MKNPLRINGKPATQHKNPAKQEPVNYSRRSKSAPATVHAVNSVLIENLGKKVNIAGNSTHMPNVIGRIIEESANCICFSNIQPPMIGAPQGVEPRPGRSTTVDEKVAAMSGIHLMVIPRKWRYNIISLDPDNEDDKKLVKEMHELGIACVKKLINHLGNEAKNISEFIKYTVPKIKNISNNDEKTMFTNEELRNILNQMRKNFYNKNKMNTQEIEKNVLTGFHIWPTHSTGHLHMHVVYLPLMSHDAFKYNVDNKFVVTQDFLNNNNNGSHMNKLTISNSKFKGELNPIEMSEYRSRREKFLGWHESNMKSEPNIPVNFTGKNKNVVNRAMMYEGLLTGMYNDKGVLKPFGGILGTSPYMKKFSEAITKRNTSVKFETLPYKAFAKHMYGKKEA